MAASFKFRVSKALFSTATGKATTPFPSFRAAKSAILSESNPEKLVQLFEQSAQYPTFRRHRPIFHRSIQKLARARRPDLVHCLLQAQQQQQNPPSPLLKSEGFWIRLAMLYSNAGMPDQAIKTLEDASSSGNLVLSEKSLCAILSCHLNNGLFDKVHQLFDEMPHKLGFTPGVVANNLVLKAFVEEGKVEQARQWLEKMGRDGNVKPDINSYNILLGAYLKRKEANEFDKLVKQILNNGLESNMTAYNHRILRLCKNKECVRAKKLFDEMVAKGVKPNSASYNTVIDGFCRVGDFESAKKVLDRMLTDGHVLPCSLTYYLLIRSMVKEGELDSALEVCQEILKRKWVPPFEVMEGLVRGLVEVSRVEEAKGVVEKMKKRLGGRAVDSWGKVEASLPL